MTLEQNKETAREFLAASARHDAALLAALMTDDATYWVQRKPHLFTFRYGKIARVQEYVDTYHAAEIFCG